MNQDIQPYLGNCRECNTLKPNQRQKVPPHDITDLPFKKVVTNLMEYGGESYVVFVDFLTKWIELIKLKNKT